MKLIDQFKSILPTWPEITLYDLKIVGILVIIGIMIYFLRSLSHPVCHSDSDTCRFDHLQQTY